MTNKNGKVTTLTKTQAAKALGLDSRKELSQDWPIALTKGKAKPTIKPKEVNEGKPTLEEIAERKTINASMGSRYG
jgi:hypothetical protein